MDTNKPFDVVNRLVEVTIKMKFIGTKGDTLKRCDDAGIPTHIETRREYDEKRASQEQDAKQSGIDAERYGRVDRLEHVIYDPGVQIAHGTDVKLETFRRDLELQGFQLVSLENFQGFGKPTSEYFFTCIYAKDGRPALAATPNQIKMINWFFARTFGNVYVWRNYGGKQFDIPALGIRMDPKVVSVDMRLYKEGRMLRVGDQTVMVEFEKEESTVKA